MSIHLPSMPVPKISHEAHVQRYYGGSARTIYTTAQETQFPDGYLIISRTDLEGIITHANDAFVYMSGWAREEIIGAPQSIVRHPDMPQAAFKGLWDDIRAGKKWRGYVKNLRKDGGYYWGYATIVPNVRGGKITGYTSVRRQPSRAKIQEAATIYRTMKAIESAVAPSPMHL